MVGVQFQSVFASLKIMDIENCKAAFFIKSFFSFFYRYEQFFNAVALHFVSFVMGITFCFSMILFFSDIVEEAHRLCGY